MWRCDARPTKEKKISTLSKEYVSKPQSLVFFPCLPLPPPSPPSPTPLVRCRCVCCDSLVAIVSRGVCVASLVPSVSDNTTIRPCPPLPLSSLNTTTGLVVLFLFFQNDDVRNPIPRPAFTKIQTTCQTIIMTT